MRKKYSPLNSISKNQTASNLPKQFLFLVIPDMIRNNSIPKSMKAWWFGISRTSVHAFALTGSLGQKQQQEDPCQTKSRVVGDIEYCDRYWECVNGRPELFDCPNGLVFAGKHRGVTEGCDYPWRANYCDGKRQANPPISTEHCDWLYGIFGHETSCTRYWTCWNGTATEQLCIGGLLYNERARSCDWPENVEGCQKHRKYDEVEK